MKKIAFYLILLTSFTISCNSKTSNSIENAVIEKKEVSPHPKKVNQKFFTSFGDGDTLTVKSFHGGTGIEYPTYEEAVWNNETEGMILIKNVKHGGASEWKESFVVKNQKVKEPFSPLHENYGLNQSLLKSVWEDIANKNYQKVVEKGISENLIEIKNLEKIGNLVDAKEKVSWKLNMKRIDKDLVQYSLFAYPPRFYGDPVFPPFIEIEISVDNSINPNKLKSFNLRLVPEINMDKFKEIGINPKYIK
jgi:hypothetical protein